MTYTQGETNGRYWVNISQGGVRVTILFADMESVNSFIVSLGNSINELDD